MRDVTEKLRKILPPLLTIRQYCAVKNCCQATCYNHLRDRPGLGIKDGHRTKILRDVMLDQMAHMPAWIPQKDRVPKASAAGPPKPKRPKKRTARRGPDPEARP